MNNIDKGLSTATDATSILFIVDYQFECYKQNEINRDFSLVIFSQFRQKKKYATKEKLRKQKQITTYLICRITFTIL